MRNNTVVNTSVSKSESGQQSFNVLFTCVGRRVALLRAFREALAELNLQGKLVGADVTVAAPGYHLADVGELVPQTSDSRYIDALKELVTRHAIRLVVPLTDLDLICLSRHRDEFAAMGCTVMISSPEAVAICRNKIHFNSLLTEAGLTGIRTVSLTEFRQNSFYPCFVKPISGSAGIGKALLRNDHELTAHLATFGEQMLFQDYVPGQEYTLDMYCRRDGVTCAVVPRQRLSIRAGEVEKGITVKDDELVAAAIQLVKHLPGLWGVVNAQCRRAPGGPPRFFELNPRFGGGVPLSLAAGVNLPKLVIQETLGQIIEPRLGQFIDRLLMLRYDEAVFARVDSPELLPGHEEPFSK